MKEQAQYLISTVCDAPRYDLPEQGIEPRSQHGLLDLRSFREILRNATATGNHTLTRSAQQVLCAQAGQGFTNSTLTRDYEPYLIPHYRENLSHPFPEPSAPVQIMRNKRRIGSLKDTGHDSRNRHHAHHQGHLTPTSCSSAAVVASTTPCGAQSRFSCSNHHILQPIFSSFSSFSLFSSKMQASQAAAKD